MDLQNEELWRKGMADHPDAEPRREFVEGLERLLMEKARRKRPRTLAWIGGSVGVAAVAAAAVLLAPTVQEVMQKPQPHVQVGANEPVVENPIVYVYETHNLESFLPETKQETDKQTNITLVGQKLAVFLTEKKIATQHRTANFMNMESMEKVYEASRAVVETDLITKDSLQVVFDVHRDSQPRAQTTVQVDGKDTARIYFIIGKGNPNFAKNEAFAKKVNAMLEELHSGVSRGVWVKANNNMESAFNQDLHPHSILVEIGGPENTLEEEYRAAQYLADAVEATLEGVRYQIDTDQLNLPLEDTGLYAVQLGVDYKLYSSTSQQVGSFVPLSYQTSGGNLDDILTKQSDNKNWRDVPGFPVRVIEVRNPEKNEVHYYYFLADHKYVYDLRLNLAEISTEKALELAQRIVFK